MWPGISNLHDARFGEVKATCPTSHTTLVFGSGCSETKHIKDTSTVGLDYPCGVAILPDSDFFVVTAYWKNPYVFERVSHLLVRDLYTYSTFFGYSHISAY